MGAVGESRRARTGSRGALSLAAMMLLLVPVGSADAQQRQKAKSAGKVVVPAQTETIRFPFDEDRDPETRSFTLEARPPLKPKPKLRFEFAGDLLTEDGDAFPMDQIDVVPKRTKFGNVEVKVTLRPEGDVDVEAGAYTGTLAVAGKRVEPGAVTLSATLRDSKGKAIVWALLGFFLGLLVKVAGDFSRMKPGQVEQIAASALLTDRGQKISAAVKRQMLERVAQGDRYFKLRQYFLSGSFASSVLLGLLGAASAYALAYLANDTWGADSLDNWKVAAAAFAGVLTGVSGADLIKPFRPTTPTT